MARNLSRSAVAAVGVAIGLAVVFTRGTAPRAAAKFPRASHARTVRSVGRRRTPTAPGYTPSSYGMSITYYSVRGQGTTYLTLNNKGPHVMKPVLTLYARDGRAYRVENLPVSPHTFRVVDLRPLAAAAGSGFEDGSLRMSYVGEIMELGGVLQMTDPDRGLEFYEQLMYPLSPKTTQLEGVWWLPSAEARARLVVTNTTGASSVATVTFIGTHGGRHQVSVTLGAWQLQAIDWPTEFIGESRADEAGGVSVTYTGPPGTVVAHGLVEDAPARYSASLVLADPGLQTTSRYEGPGVRVGLGAERLRPILVAHNVGTAWSHLEGRLRVTGADGTVHTVDLPATTLAPGEVQQVDAEGAWARAAALQGGNAVGVEFDYSSPPGTVVLALSTVNDTRSQVFATPLTDPGTLPSATGGYFFELSRTLDSVVFIKNMTDRPLNYHLFISAETGSWLPGVKTIAPHETQVFDIAQLRDGHVPDAKGHTIPTDATNGQVHWSVLGHTDPKGLVGRMEHVDLTHDVDSTYACTYYGDDYYDSSYIDPDSTSVAVGEDTYFTAWEQDSNAYGDSFDDAYNITDDLDWTSGDPTIANSDFDSDFFGISNGETYIHASGESLSPCSPDSREGCDDENEDGDVPIDLYADFTSAQCPGDSQRSAILQEYVNYHAAHTTFFAGGLPACADFSSTRQSASFSFSQINTGDYTVALIRAPLIAAASSGYGLDKWVAAFGASRAINSSFRNPARNTAVHGVEADNTPPGQHTGSRHMYGDAADFNNDSGTLDEWNAMVSAAHAANADYVEGSDQKCGTACTHADWRFHTGSYQ